MLGEDSVTAEATFPARNGIFLSPPEPQLASLSLTIYVVSKRVASKLERTVLGMAKAQHAPRYRYLPALLRELREGASFTQRDLAKKMAVTHVFIHKSEIGDRRVDVTEFMDWCLACGVNPEEAFRRLRKHRSV